MNQTIGGRRPGLLTSAWTGIGAGIGSTLAMSLVMVAGEKLGLMGEHPPSRIGDRILGRLAPFRPRRETDALGTGIHLVIGAGLGAGFAVLRRVAPPFRLPFAGVAYGLAVWATAYAGLLPALRIMPMPDRDRPGRQPTMIAAHVVFGLALARLTRGVLPPASPAERRSAPVHADHVDGG